MREGRNSRGWGSGQEQKGEEPWRDVETVGHRVSQARDVAYGLKEESMGTSGETGGGCGYSRLRELAKAQGWLGGLSEMKDQQGWG